MSFRDMVRIATHDPDEPAVLLRDTTGQTETPILAAGVPVNPGVEPVSGAAGQHSTVAAGVQRSADHKYWVNGIGPFHSVTTMLDVIHKEALSEWLKRKVAEIAVERYAELGEKIAQDPAQAVEWLRGMPGHVRDTAARLGTSVHLLADMEARGAVSDAKAFQVNAQTQPYLDAFRGFLDVYGRSNIISSEKAVVHFAQGYAGTYDFLLTLNGELWLVDVKTSAQLYPETGLQLAAYGNAEFIVLPEDPTLYPMPHIDRYGVLHLRPDKYAKGWRFVEYGVTERDYRAFLAARDLWDWRKEGRFRDTATVTEPVTA